MTKTGLFFGSIEASPTVWTVVGFFAAICSAIFYSISNIFGIDSQFNFIVVAACMLLISGFFDIVDGCVARYKQKVSKRGAFIDSTLDKLAEFAILTGVTIGSLSDPIISILAISISFMVSYVRARAESLQIDLKGIGIGERAERMIILAIASFIPVSYSIQIGIILIIIISVITLTQRVLYVTKRL
jgi:archaetidylinositol phosphate synthase